jgi:hypothetical protein
MELENPSGPLRIVAALVRGCLTEFSTALRRRPGSAAPARHATAVIVAAAAPFAATPYARARLLRQLHATGLLTAAEAGRAAGLLDGAPNRPPTPNAVSC